jgi:hypothetical protein
MKTLAAFVVLSTGLMLPSSTGAATVVGTTTVYSPVTKNGKGVAEAYRFKARSSGRVDRLNVYLHGTSTATRVTLGLYTGSRSRARARRARCTIASTRAGAWNTCSFASYRVRAGKYYWLALLQPARSKGRLRYREGRRSGGPVTYLSTRKRLSSLPSRWRNGAASRGGYRASIYASDADGVPPVGGGPLPPPPPGGSPPLPPAPPSAFPDESNTGVPPGVALRSSAGITVSTPGAVIDGVDAPWISVDAPNVTIRNSLIRGGIINRRTGLLVEDSTIDGNDGTAIVDADYTARRLEVTGTENAFQAGDNVTLEDNWVHDLDTSGDAHTDGIQFSGGAGNIVIRHNTIDPVPDSVDATSAIIMHTGGGAQNHDVRIEDNLLDGTGASVALYCPRQNASNIFINGNRMLKGVFGDYTDECMPGHVTEFNDNVDAATGGPVRAGS